MGYCTARSNEGSDANKRECASIVAHFVKTHGRPPRDLAELENSCEASLFAVYRYDIFEAIDKALEKESLK
jgi:hypothetical protein